MVKIHTIQFKGRNYFLGYKVVTQDLKSLGLKRNPNILTYPINEWYLLPENQIAYGVQGWGGIWLARIPSGARNLKKYMKDYHNTDTKIFKSYLKEACLEDILYFNSYRVKTKGIYMFEEI